MTSGQNLTKLAIQPLSMVRLCESMSVPLTVSHAVSNISNEGGICDMPSAVHSIFFFFFFFFSIFKANMVR